MTLFSLVLWNQSGKTLHKSVSETGRHIIKIKRSEKKKQKKRREKREERREKKEED